MGYGENLPVVEQLSREVLSLPVHPALSRADLETIVEAVNDAMEQLGSMTDKRKLRAGVIGLGSMGSNHARVYDEIEGVDLVSGRRHVAGAAGIGSLRGLRRLPEDSRRRAARPSFNMRTDAAAPRGRARRH